MTEVHYRTSREKSRLPTGSHSLLGVYLHTMSGMDVRLLIVWHPTNLYQVCVFAPAAARGWIKIYESKVECFNELREIDLLTCDEEDEALASDFDLKDHMLIIQAEADPQTLLEAGFTEDTPVTPN